ncbi:hypothetical protein [Kitasatospora sp. NPDC051914]|uniref:hypothetical protein n=1 Tax=Kitasatospora sp. NPDC051914 TaxID=3154945 RepID=UPI00344377BF
MRTPVSRSVRRATTTAATALLLGTALPVLSTGSPAWAACGNDPGPALPSEPRHAEDPVTAFIQPLPTEVAAGGEAVEIGVEEGNFTGGPYQRLTPRFAVLASAPAAQQGELANLQPADVSVEVMWQGQWQRLALHRSCDPVLVADTSSLAVPLEDGRAQRYLFRVSLSAATPPELSRLDVYAGSTGSDRTEAAELTVTRSGPAAGGAGTTAAAVAAAPAADVSTPAADPAAVSAPAGTGWAGTAVLLALGGGILLTARRLRRR